MPAAQTSIATTAQRTPEPPATPDAPVPMIHANEQNNQTTLIVISAYFGSHMLSAMSIGFDALYTIYCDTGTVTEGDVYAALWPEATMLAAASTIFGPGVIGYTSKTDRFTIRVGHAQRSFDRTTVEHVITMVRAAQNGTVRDNAVQNNAVQNNTVHNGTALARRIIYLACTSSRNALDHMLDANDASDTSTVSLYACAVALHQIIPDIDEQLARIAHADTSLPMQHGMTSRCYDTYIGVLSTTERLCMPTHLGRHGGICTITADIALHPDSAIDYDADDAHPVATCTDVAVRNVYATRNTADITGDTMYHWSSGERYTVEQRSIHLTTTQ